MWFASIIKYNYTYLYDIYEIGYISQIITCTEAINRLTIYIQHNWSISCHICAVNYKENSNIKFKFYRNPNPDDMTLTSETNTSEVTGYTDGTTLPNTRTYTFTTPAVWSAGDTILFGVENMTATSDEQQKTGTIIYQIDERTLSL